jgi:hypothetical protein
MKTHKKLQGENKTPHPQQDQDGGGFVPQTEPAGLVQKAQADASTLSPADVLQLQRTLGNRAVSGLLRGTKSTVQRVFQPATVNSKSHLRANNGGEVRPSQQIGRAIPTGAEVVIDPAQQKVQTRKIISNVTWTRAVDVTGGNWNPATDPANGGFIRASKVTPKVYPEAVALTIGSRGTFNLEKRWHVDVGEYIPFEDSIENGGTQIVKVGGEFKRLDGGFQLHDLTPLEETQVNDVSREDAAEKRLALILTNAATTGGLDPALLATPRNIEGLKHPLRLTLADYDQAEKDKWNTWVQAVYAKIASGAADLVASINHWKTQLNPPNPANCHVTEIKLEGSDLHDKGLGAVFVTFLKPLGRGLFPDKTNFTVVLKPEDRNIEKSLFGTQNTSLSSQVNQHVGLTDDDDAITQIRMETHANYGSIIEFVNGQQAKAINGTGDDTQAMSEGIAFAFLTGMSDVHKENVIWRDGQPYFIDADNSLNASRLNAPSSQSGFSMNNKARTDTDIGHLTNRPQDSRSAIIQSMLQDSTPLLAAIQAAFTGKTGRVVPLYTNYWANRFKLAGYITANNGVATDGIGVDQTFSRWGIANKAAAKLPRGAREDGTGLVGESGIAATGEHFDRDTEAAQVKADLDQGKIPFYHYQYTSGHVLHNGQTIWHGQTLAQAMAILLAKFPAPPDVI